MGTIVGILAVALFAARPNIVAIVTDDQGQWACGAYGNREIKTPTMDRLAREGILFSNAFVVTPVCSPSRAAYFTGRWPTEVGITDYLTRQEEIEGYGIRQPTWPAMLQKAGYRTMMVGKWHVGANPEFHPTRHGFDEFVGTLWSAGTPQDAPIERDGKMVPTKGVLAEILTDEAIGFVQRNKERPFLLCLHFREPHLPYGPLAPIDKEAHRELDPTIPRSPGMDVAKVKAATRDYYGSIHSVDRNVGRLLAALDENGLRENTLVIFTSDHGYNEGRHGVDTKGNAQWIAGGIRGPKRPNMWDTSLKVPLIMRWPAKIKAGAQTDAWVQNIDMFRTMLAVAEVPFPEGLTVHGVDYSPLLSGGTVPKRDVLFGQYDLHNGGLAYMRMIRTDRYKYIRFFHARQMDELYDLAADPGEEKNLIRGESEPRAIVGPLRERLAAWMKSIDDPLLKDKY